MRKLLPVWLLLLSLSVAAQGDHVKLLSWNIRDLGGSKSDEEITLMAQILRDYDVIAIQEVVAKDPAGARAVARLVGTLDRMGADFDYRVSDPTQSSSSAISERYAFIWRTSKIKLIGRPKLMAAFAKTIEREPYLAEFEWQGKRFRVANFHARPHDQQPEREIAQLKTMMDTYGDEPLFVLGDFNVVSHHTVFNPWRKRNFQLALTGQRTTLKRKAPEGGDEYYAKESDNILVPAHQVQVLERGICDVVAFLRYDLERAGQVSDHAPVYIVFDDFPQLGAGRAR